MKKFKEENLETLKRSCKERCLFLLTDSDKTEMQLRKKLQVKYPEEIIEETIQFLKEYRYIDDEAYARRYVECWKGRRSEREIRSRLMEKGVSREWIEEAFSDYSDEEDLEAAQAVIQKKYGSSLELSEEQKKKLYGMLMRKGFRYETVRRALAIREGL